MLFQICAISAVLLYILWFYVENFHNRDGQPPGPLRIPPFGTLIQMGLENSVGHYALHKLAKKYGDVMSIKMGLLDARIVISEGPPNDETRRFFRDTLKSYGYGNREILCNLLLDEVIDFMKFIEDESKSNPQKKVHFGSEFFHPASLNITTRWMMDKRFSYNDPEFQQLLQYEHDVIKGGALGAGLMLAYPFLRFVFPEALGYNMQMKGTWGYFNYAKNLLQERRKGNYKLHPTCFADNFLQKMDEDSGKAEPLYTEKHFCVVFTDLMQAGTDTSSNVLNFTLLQLAANDEIQEKVFQEILNLIGNSRLPQTEDRLRMPYTQAVILEGLRWSRVVVLGVPRKTIKDFYYRDYFVEKGTILIYNMQSIFFDEETWGDPNVFRPERFIDLQGNIDPKKQEIMSLAFGTGKRMCLGDVLGRDSVFIFITALIQKFKFSLPPGVKPNMEPCVGLTLYTAPYDGIVTPREK